MNVSVRKVRDAAVVAVDGRLDALTAPDLEAALRDLVDGGAAKVVLDLGDAVYVSSAGLRVMLVTAKGLKAKAGELRVCSLTEHVHEVFDISGFTSLLDVYPTADEALAGF